jgi:hypothetical protein
MDFYNSSYIFGGKSHTQTFNKLNNAILITNELSDLCREYYPHPKIEPILNITPEDKLDSFRVFIGTGIFVISM